jgi:hypothetical protein
MVAAYTANSVPPADESALPTNEALAVPGPDR